MQFFWETLIGDSTNDNRLPPSLLGTTPVAPSPDNPKTLQIKLMTVGLWPHTKTPRNSRLK